MNGMPSAWELVLFHATTLLPVLVVAFGGMMYAAARVRRVGRPAGMVFAGCLVMFVAEVIGPVVQDYLFWSDPLNGGSSPWIGFAAVATSTMFAIGLGLVIAAAFIGRTPSPSDE